MLYAFLLSPPITRRVLGVSKCECIIYGIHFRLIEMINWHQLFVHGWPVPWEEEILVGGEVLRSFGLLVSRPGHGQGRRRGIPFEIDWNLCAAPVAAAAAAAPTKAFSWIGTQHSQHICLESARLNMWTFWDNTERDGSLRVPWALRTGFLPRDFQAFCCWLGRMDTMCSGALSEQLSS